MRAILIFFSCAFAVFGISSLMISSNAQATAYPVEAGPAKFMRDHDKAMAESKKTGKPVFAFFQEVPG